MTNQAYIKYREMLQNGSEQNLGNVNTTTNQV